MALITKVDNLDDRRELWRLLSKLPPADRYQFLEWCCARSMGKGKVVPNFFKMRRRIEMATRGKTDHDDALTNEVYFDLHTLGIQYGLDLAVAQVELERRVRVRR